MIIDDENFLQHIGTPRHSGRYPWGSSNNVAGRNASFHELYQEMKAKGLSDTEIAEGWKITTTELRQQRTIENAARLASEVSMAQRLRDKGNSPQAIAERMGLSEATVRNRLRPGAAAKAEELHALRDSIKREVDAKKYVDVGGGVETQIGVSRTNLKTAISMLENDGYKIQYVQTQQLGTGLNTTKPVLTKDTVSYSELSKNQDKVQQFKEYKNDSGVGFSGFVDPIHVNSKRLSINYAEDGGDQADGVVYVRPGVEDLSLGKNAYAQVRVGIDGTHYIKGMAIYKDDLPPGVDLQFNTNKSDTGNKLDALKKLKDDAEMPFGSVVHQIKTPDGKKATSAMNLVNEEGDWDDWSRNLAPQMLSKQSHKLAETQLREAYDKKKADLDEINGLTNPTVKKHLLESYADDADAAAVHMKAASLDRQATKVILPINSIKDNEIYAPSFRDGEQVALIRYPHAGTFEIPELTVNNRNPAAKKIFGNLEDAVGINAAVAERLSGADFDGDAVVVIPQGNNRPIKSTPALQDLKGFDGKKTYAPYDGMKTIDGGTWDAEKREAVFPPGKKPNSKTMQKEMGVVSNLITDMTIRGADTEELARAAKHSQVVIDAEKHHLDYKESERANNIAQLKAKYQTPYQESGRSGASTLISRAKADVRVNTRKDRLASEGGPIDPKTGKRVYTDLPNDTYVDSRDGKTYRRQFKSKKLAETDDAHTLSSGTRMEGIYADHSNRMKQLANEARLSYHNTHEPSKSPSAAKVYEKEVASLNEAHRRAELNRPKERAAQTLGNALYKARVQANPDMTDSEKKKYKGWAQTEARARLGAKKEKIVISDSEWEAIQAGAISKTRLAAILRNADLEVVRAHATPKQRPVMTSSKTARAQRMMASGNFTQAEIASHLGVSLSTLKLSLG